MLETSTPSTDLNRAARDAKKQAGEVSDAAQDLYNQAVDSASHTAGSFERACATPSKNSPIRL